MAVESMLKGQEEERTRLAKDLHDGLGGMLSGVKINFFKYERQYDHGSATIGKF